MGREQSGDRSGAAAALVAEDARGEGRAGSGEAAHPPVRRLASPTAFVSLGALAVLAGGFVAAAGGESPSRHLSWASAYLVLVCGLAQVALGAGQWRVSARPPRPDLVLFELWTFNLGNLAVLAGTLAGSPPVLAAGSVVLLGSLALFAFATRRAALGRRAGPLAYRVLVAVLAVSIPVGGLLSR